MPFLLILDFDDDYYDPLMYGAQPDNRGNQCGMCGKNYKQPKTLVRHIRHECGLLPTISCSFCSFVTKYSFSLDSHLKKKHLNVNRGIIHVRF